MQSAPPPVLNIHTPTSSFALIHSLTQESIDELYDKLARKGYGHSSSSLGPGWLKYEYNGSVWNLDDDSDYTIFAWRQQEANALHQEAVSTGIAMTPVDYAQSAAASSSRVTLPESRSALLSGTTVHSTISPTLHLHNPAEHLPEPPAYQNPSFYLFQAHSEPVGRSPSRGSKKKAAKGVDKPFVPKLKKDFEKFHSENGVRTVMGSIGPVENVRMLLKAGHRHVYISRKFAVRHGFIPPDSAPGNYGYGGLVSIGEWPITLTPSASSGQVPPPVLYTDPSAHASPKLGGSPNTAASYAGPDAFGLRGLPGHGHNDTSISSALHGAPHRRSQSHSPYSSVLSLGLLGGGAGGSGTMGGGSSLLAPLPGLFPSTTPLLLGPGTGNRHNPTNSSTLLPSSRSTHTTRTARSGGPLPNPTPASKLTKAERARTQAHAATAPANGLNPVMVEVWLSEEPHFDVVLGRSFFEKRKVKVSLVDPTDVWCLDTGEKIECEVVILKDGRGEIVTVT